MRAPASVLGLLKLNLSSLSSGLDLIGTNAGYSNATPSRLSAILASTTAHVVVFANVDSAKRLSSDDGNATAFLRQVLDVSAHPKDAFADCEMGLSEFAFVATEDIATDSVVADLATVVVNVPKLTRQAKLAAAMELLADRGLTADVDGISVLADEYALDDGIAGLTRAVDALSQHRPGTREGKTIDLATVRKTLPAPDEDDPRLWLARKRRALEAMGRQHVRLAERLTAEVMEQRRHDDPSPDQEKKLRVLLGSVPRLGSALPALPSAELKAALGETHPGMAEATLAKLVAAVSAALRNKERVRPILLVGPAGTGKTTLCSSVAATLGIEVVKRDCSGLSVGELFGSAARPFFLTEAAASFDGAPQVLLLDEVDKMSEPLCSTAALCPVLDYACITECFLDLPVDLSGWLFFLTANDLGRVSDYIVDRCQVVHVEGYTPRQKKSIAEKTLVARKASELGIEAPQIEDGVLDLLAAGDEAGLRQCESGLELLLSSSAGGVVTFADAEAMLSEPHGLGAGDAVEVLMARGGAKGGAVLGMVGASRLRKGKGKGPLVFGTSAFERSVHKARAALGFTGLVDEGKGDFVATLEASGDDLDYGFSPHSELGLAMALWRALDDNRCDFGDVAFVGELSPTGMLRPVSKEMLAKGPFMVARAARFGAATIVCPNNLSTDGPTRTEAQLSGINLVGVGELRRAAEFVSSRNDMLRQTRELLR